MIKSFSLFHCAYMQIPRRAIIDDNSWGKIRIPLLCGLIEHERLGPILIDAPYGHEGPKNLGNVLGNLMRFTAIAFEERWSVVPRIEELGFRASEVDHLLMTHLHYDHTGGMKTLAHAEFHASQAEWEYATESSAKISAARGYMQDDYLSLAPKMKTYDGIPHLLETSKGLDLFGDGSVEMLFLPGHTPGHSVYRLHLQSGKKIFFLGDAAFTVGQLRGEEALGFFPRAIASSISGARTSLRAVERHIEEHPEDLLITSHDPILGARCIDKGPISWH